MIVLFKNKTAAKFDTTFKMVKRAGINLRNGNQGADANCNIEN